MIDQKALSELMEQLMPVVQQAMDSYFKLKEDATRKTSSEYVILHIVNQTRDLMFEASSAVAGEQTAEAKERALSTMHACAIILDMVGSLRDDPNHPSPRIILGPKTERAKAGGAVG
jgi:DNA-binding transcriptional regulator YbjK